MTLLTTFLKPCEFDPTVWSDATLGRTMHRAAQCIYHREVEHAATALAEMPEDLPIDLAMARFICELTLLNHSAETAAALELFERKRDIIDPFAPLGALAQYQAAVALVSAHRHEEALELLAVAECTFRELDDHIALGLTYGLVGGTLNDLGDTGSSVKYFAASYEELSAYGTDRQISRASFNLVYAYAFIGRHEDAFRIAERHFALFTDETEAPERSVIYGRLGYCCELLGRYEEALKWNAMHIELARQHQQNQLLIYLEIDHALLALRLKRCDEARQILATIPDSSPVEEMGDYAVRLAFAHGLIALEDENEAAASEAFTKAIEYCTLHDVSDELRLRVINEIVQLTQREDGLPRSDFAAVYITHLKQRTSHLHQTSSTMLDAHLSYASRLAKYQRERDEQLHTTLVESGEQTRRDVASAIHDGAGQELAVIGMQLDTALQNLPEDHPAREHVVRSRNRVSLAAAQLRKLSHALGTHSLERDGLPSALYDLASDVRSTSRISVSCVVDESLATLPLDVARSIYRSVQTLVSNVLQHAFAQHLEISVSTDGDRVTVRVHDDGRGFETSQKTHGMGWKSIRARTELRGGSFVVTSQPGEGTTATAAFSYSGNA